MAHKPIRIGLISVLDRDAGAARVTFPDLDDLVSGFLPIMKTSRTKWASQGDFPDVEEHVLVLFVSESMSDGFIIGSYQLEDADSPLTPDQFGTVFEDGSFAYYDRSTKTMFVHSEGNVTVTGGNVKIDSDNVQLTAENVQITGQSVTLNAPNVQMTGNLNVSGTITGGGS